MFFFTFSRKSTFLLWHLLMHPRRVKRHLHRVDMTDSVSADNSWARNISRCKSFLHHFSSIFYRFRNSLDFFRFWIFEDDFRLAALFRRVESKVGIWTRWIRKWRVFVESLKRQRKSGGKKTLFRLSFDTSSLFHVRRSGCNAFWFRLANFVQTTIQTEKTK